jgi:dipeptidyl aminopeptidase/acylaminoacyl peptidase
VRKLTTGHVDHEHPAWSPDGRLLAFSSGPVDASRIYCIDRRGRFAFAVAPNGPRASRPRWAPDGRRIAFDARPLEGPPVVLVSDLPESGLEPRPVVPARSGGGGAVIHAAFSPDGRTLAYASDEGSPGQYHLWLVDLESQARRKLTDEAEGNDAHPAFSPDGTLLVFHRYVERNAHRSNLWLLNVTSGQLLRLTDADGFDKHACFATPDVVVYHREHGDGSQELRTCHVIEGHDAPLLWGDARGHGNGKRDAKQPAVRLTRRGRIRVAFSGREHGEADAAGPYDLYVGALDGLDDWG